MSSRPQSVSAYTGFFAIPDFPFKAILKNGYPHRKLKTLKIKAKT